MNPMEWWTPEMAGLIGGGIGTLIGLWGGLAGVMMWLLSRGTVGVRTVVVFLIASSLLAAALFAASVWASIVGQPAHVWRPLGQPAGIWVLAIILLAVATPMAKQYERRKLAAAEFRADMTA